MQEKRNINFIRPAALLLAVLLAALCLRPVPAHAAGGKAGDLKWDLTGSTLTLSGKGAMPDYTESTPAPWAEMVSSIKAVVVEKGVTAIGSLAFYNCAALDSVTLADSVVSIGSRAFMDCTALKRLVLPSAVTSIGEAAFQRCESLTAIYLPAGLTTMGDYAFYRCSALRSVIIPESVEQLGMVTFAYCTSLASATIRCPVDKIPDWTFYGCTGLLSVTLPDTARSAGENAFHNCTGLKDICYGGSAASDLLTSIRQDSTALAPDAAVRAPGEEKNTTTVTIPGGSGDTSSTTVIEGDHTTIVKETETTISGSKDGQDLPWSEVEKEAESGGDVDISIKDKTTISATVGSSEGWTELADEVQEASKDRFDKDTQVEVDVQLEGSKLKGDDLGKLAGSDATLEITTDKGSRWRIDTAGMTEKDVAGKTYDLDHEITREDKSKKGIDADEVYKLQLKDGIGGKSLIAVHIPGSKSGSYATLYEKKWFHYVERETVLIDMNGDAWFNVSDITSGKTLFIGINARGVDAGKATVPHTMYTSKDIDPKYTLTDADGNYYAVGERESSWGITKKQFTLYAVLGLGAVVLVVTIVMVTINTVKKSKRKVAAEHGEALPSEETEEEMRIRIMQEMLDESKKNKS